MGLVLPSGTGTGTLHKLDSSQIWKEDSCLRPAPAEKGPGTADPNSLSPVRETDTGLCENTHLQKAAASF